DTIITGGENVSPLEVERVLESHAAIMEAGVYAVQHPEWGEAINAKVVVRFKEDLDIEELRKFCANKLARYKIPKSFEQVEALPRTNSGKLLRRELSTKS